MCLLILKSFLSSVVLCEITAYGVLQTKSMEMLKIEILITCYVIEDNGNKTRKASSGHWPPLAVRKVIANTDAWSCQISGALKGLKASF